MATVLAGRVNQLLLIFTYVPVVEKSTCIVGKNDRLELGFKLGVGFLILSFNSDLSDSA